MRNNKMELRMAMADFNNTTEMEVDLDELQYYQELWNNVQRTISEFCNDIVDIAEAIKRDKYVCYADECEREERELHEYGRHLDNGDEGYSWDFYSDWYKDVYGIRPRW